MADPSSQPPVAQIYDSLPLTSPTSIRVLDVQAPNPNEANGGALHGNLRIIDLAAVPTPSFTALSYVWGDIQDAATTSTLTLGPDRLSLQLTNNCHEALKHLLFIVSPLTIWVDAICIYQNDVKEKNHQIPLMGEIYSQAETTFIWLGPSDDISTRVMKSLSHMGYLDCFFSTQEQNPAAPIRPRPWSAALRAQWYGLLHALPCCSYDHDSDHHDYYQTERCKSDHLLRSNHMYRAAKSL